MSLLLMVGSPISAQEAADNDPSDKASILRELQRKLDEGGNPMGIRVEDYQELPMEPLHEDTLASAESASNGKRKSAARVFDTAPKYIISYMSVDGKKDSIRLSATVYTREEKHDHYFDKLLISCHPTVTSLFEAPTGGNPVDKDIKRIVDDNYMVVCPDYCGYGISAYRQHPYLIHDVTARNCVDAAMAAKIFGKSLTGKEVPASFSTYIVGYSQGGATALACAKYLESDACPENYKTELNLHETACGDGPYSTLATVNQYIKWGKEGKNLEYPCVLPLIVMAAKEAYGDGCMRTVEVEDYFSDEFKATGIIEMLKNKSMTTIDLNKEVDTKMNHHLLPKDLFSDKIFDKEKGDFKTNSNEYKCLMRAMEIGDLSTGWEPQHPITFFHLKNDGVVPYANYEAVMDKKGIQYKKDGTKNNNVKSVDPDATIAEYAVMYMSGLPFYSYAAYFPVPPFDLILRAWQKVHLDRLNHATGGKWFYILYLWKDDYMRH